MAVGDVVWGKIHGFPWWPGKVLSITISRKDDGASLAPQAHVAWYGSSTSSLMPCDQLSPFLETFKVASISVNSYRQHPTVSVDNDKLNNLTPSILTPKQTTTDILKADLVNSNPFALQVVHLTHLCPDAQRNNALVEHAGNHQTTSLLRRNLPNKYDATTVCLGEEKDSWRDLIPPKSQNTEQIYSLVCLRITDADSEDEDCKDSDRAQLQAAAELVTELLDIVQPYNEEGGTDIRKDSDLISNEIENSPPPTRRIKRERNKVDLPGYVLCRNDRVGKRGGGCAVYVRSDLQPRVLRQSPNQYAARPEFMFIEICASYQKCLISVVYKPPQT
ncbi:hypothetical protein ANN_00723 [Periplaneta americana]|uniref:PWWP domain-containing protein n=1 Tax=Periplaneta americana TaxID=6978 RepID=A0ABQ8TVK8_PERAM|nr:hypothetical protein ANN_00723 [Periplaneta americana]